MAGELGARDMEEGRAGAVKGPALPAPPTTPSAQQANNDDDDHRTLMETLTRSLALPFVPRLSSIRTNSTRVTLPSISALASFFPSRAPLSSTSVNYRSLSSSDGIDTPPATPCSLTAAPSCGPCAAISPPPLSVPAASKLLLQRLLCRVLLALPLILLGAIVVALGPLALPILPPYERTASNSASVRVARPPMGWNSWNHFGCGIGEGVIRETADALVASGLRDAGYRFLNLDDCWQAQARDAGGRLVADPSGFPSGIGALAQYAHARGLAFGLYSDAGTRTCAGRAGSLGHEATDARTFGDWGVDYLKYDNCFPGVLNFFPFPRYKAMGDALRSTPSAKHIVFSMCEWGLLFPALWGRRLAQADLWRTTPDIHNNWEDFMLRASQNNKWAGFAGPGGWNDPDMLEVGNGVLTPGEDRVHFSLWCIIKAPLLIGCDVRNMTEETRATLTNEEAIAVNQDPLGVQGVRVRKDAHSEVWAGPLAGGKMAVALVNKDKDAREVSMDPRALLRVRWGQAPYTVRDIWQAQTSVAEGHILKRTVPSHDVAFLILSEGLPPSL